MFCPNGMDGFSHDAKTADYSSDKRQENGLLDYGCRAIGRWIVERCGFGSFGETCGREDGLGMKISKAEG